MKCKFCGANCSDGDIECPACGATLVMQSVTPVYYRETKSQNKQDNLKEKFDVRDYSQENKSEKTGMASLILGLLAIVMCEIPIVGIILGAYGKKSAANIDDGYAKAGKILSVIGIIFSIIVGLGYFLLYVD